VSDSTNLIILKIDSNAFLEGTFFIQVRKCTEEIQLKTANHQLQPLASFRLPGKQLLAVTSSNF
jgi:hypothetical protein